MHQYDMKQLDFSNQIKDRLVGEATATIPTTTFLAATATAFILTTTFFVAAATTLATVAATTGNFQFRFSQLSEQSRTSNFDIRNSNICHD
jgi:hypothetical protein